MSQKKINRRQFIKRSAAASAAITAGLAASPIFAAKRTGLSKRVIIIGVDGMDPILTERMMNEGRLPNFDRLRKQGGYSKLGTSTPPQSPVAWSNFINGAGPGSHGIFDFIHRNPEGQVAPFLSTSETVPGAGYLKLGDHRHQLTFWPFNHKPSETLLRRQGTPFWDYLDKDGISSTFYNLPSNYPPSKSKYGNHRCLAGMGTPDMQGSYGGYHLFSEDGPVRMTDDGGCKKSMLFFENDYTAEAEIYGPPNAFHKDPDPVPIKFLVHRDLDSNAGLIEIQDQKIPLKPGQWSDWKKLDFQLSAFGPDMHVSGICRFYLQEVSPNFRLYASPINTDPSDPALQITEPAGFIKDISKKLGLFYTTGFQEDHKALSTGVFTDAEFAEQSGIVLDERLRLLDYAVGNYDDGLLFFYFSSTDLQAHMFWWDSKEKHPTRSVDEAVKYFGHIQGIYSKMDDVLGDIMARYGDKATVIVMSDHGFANFKRQFNLNTWLKKNGYLYPADATSVLAPDIDWSKTKAYGLGINGLYLNLQGRERDGIVIDGDEKEKLLQEIVTKLQAEKDVNGNLIIRQAHRTDQAYFGPAARLAPDIIVGYTRGYRASWDTCLGGMNEDVLSDNDSAWSADHCADISEVPGIIFSNKPIAKSDPSLIDVAPSVLAEFGMNTPETMQGKNIFTT